MLTLNIEYQLIEYCTSKKLITTKYSVMKKIISITITRFSILFLLVIASTNIDAKNTSPLDSSSKTFKKINNSYKASKTLFGHQEGLLYGIKWKELNDMSDTKLAIGKHPQLSGYEISGIEKNATKNINGVPFDMIKKSIKENYSKNGVAIFSWHMDNPFNDGDSWNVNNVDLNELLPGGKYHEKYKKNMNSFVKFMSSLEIGSFKDKVFFRPFHEANGKWFWWGHLSYNDDEAFRKLWMWTNHYIKSFPKMKELQFVYSTDRIKTKEEYLSRCVLNDNVVDLLAFDSYQQNEKDNFKDALSLSASIVSEIADETGLPYAISEIGYDQIPDKNWWTETLEPVINEYNFKFVMLWRNAGFLTKTQRYHYYIPYKGDISYNDFVDFAKNSKLVWRER